MVASSDATAAAATASLTPASQISHSKPPYMKSLPSSTTSPGSHSAPNDAPNGSHENDCGVSENRNGSSPCKETTIPNNPAARLARIGIHHTKANARAAPNNSATVKFRV